MDIKKHWETIYSRKPPQSLGWYTPQLQTALTWINELAVPKEAHVIDVGCGASTLIDDLATLGYKSLTGLDISEKALSIIQDRLTGMTESICWLRGDVTEMDLPHQYYTFWHDRAVFHFLVDEEKQAQYIKKLSGALLPGGYAIMGVFSSEAPPVCSGLRVQRYTAKTLSATLDKNLDLVKHKEEVHITPGGVEQVYLYCLFRKHSK